MYIRIARINCIRRIIDIYTVSRIIFIITVFDKVLQIILFSVGRLNDFTVQFQIECEYALLSDRKFFCFTDTVNVFVSVTVAVISNDFYDLVRICGSRFKLFTFPVIPGVIYFVPFTATAVIMDRLLSNMINIFISALCFKLEVKAQ